MIAGLVLDPAPRLAVRAALGLLFAWAAAHKLRDMEGLRAALEGYDLLPRRWLGAAARLLVAVEVGVSAALWVGNGARPAYAAAALLTLYAGAIVLNLLRGRRDIDCGCAAAARHQPLSVGLACRNGVLIAAALASALPARPRGLTPIDALTIGASVVTLVLLYAAVDGLLAQAARHPRRKRADGMAEWIGLQREEGHV